MNIFKTILDAFVPIIFEIVPFHSPPVVLRMSIQRKLHDCLGVGYHYMGYLNVLLESTDINQTMHRNVNE